MLTMRWLACVIWLAATALAGTAAPPKANAPSVISPNIILITLDTTRADRMGFLGSTRGLTPNLDALAGQSVVFTRAYAQAPLTTVSHATILTGTYPQFHQVLDFTYPLAKDLPYAPDILRAHGYRTAAFLGSLVLDAGVGAPGFDRGFDTYDSHFEAEDFSRGGHAQGGEFSAGRRPGAEVVARALAWLKQHPAGPFFLWVHLYDAHDPYQPPEPYKTKYAAEPYDGGIAYEDSVVGTLLQQLKARGLYDGATIAVMADHGESLGAHGEDTHGIFLYDETIRVPLLIKLPGASATGNPSTGKRIETRVELADVMPTMLQAAGVEVPAVVQGESLLGLMKAAAGDGAADLWRDRAAYAQSDYPHAFGWSALQSLRTGKYLYVQAPRRELYDEAADPKSEHNLATEMKAVADTVGDRLETFRQKTSSKREAPRMSEDPAAQAKLAALGYAMSTTVPKAGSNGQEADPKDNIEAIKGMRRVSFLMKIRRYDGAIRLLQQLIAKDASIPILYYELGDCYVDLRQYDKAVAALRKAVELAPTFAMARLDLGKVLMQVKDFAAAVPELERVAADLPRTDKTRLLLANAYIHTGRMPEAIAQCNQVLEASPDDYAANVLLGRALVLSGDAAAAVPKLKKASALQPNLPEPHTLLADAYVKLGQKTEAERERAEAESLGAGDEE